MGNREAIRILSMFTTDEAQRLTSSEFDDAIYMAIKALNNFNVWIPCSERLPNECKDVLIQPWWAKGKYDYEIADLCAGEWCCDQFKLLAEEVVAWMPLPELYQGE